MPTQSIVIVEDEAVIARDLQLLLEDLGYAVPAIAATADEALASIDAAAPDLVLMDIRLADGSDGITVAEAILARWAIPVVFLTAHADPVTVARAQATSPYGYLLKPFNEREVAISVQLALAKSASDRQLRASERLFATTLRSIAEGVIITDAASQVAFLNPAAEALTGWTQPEAVGRPITDVCIVQAPDGCAPLGDLVTTVLAQGQTSALPDGSVLLPRDGALRQVADSIAPLVDSLGGRWGTVVVVQDVTAQRATAAAHQDLERKLVEMQRVESLGLLASGIAHDFNNILMNVLAYTEMAQEGVPAESHVQGQLMRAISGIHQAAGLTKQLLTYAGKGEIRIGPVALNPVVHELIDLLRGSFVRSIAVQLELAVALPPVLGDSTQIRQVVLNLLTNAAEAIGAGPGQITVATSQVELTPALRENLAFGAEAAPGPHVCLSVRDTGGGMEPAILAKIFDPFFTTKVAGRGLGLASVLGIVRQHRGGLRVTSAVGQGTTFAIVLPVADRLNAGQ
ncbi:MAG: ATP-binding protein [Chloroflexales bacterium]